MFSQSSSNLLKKQHEAREGAVQYTGLDEEQEIKYHEIVDLLLAGGYFRARISGLSPFDKVVGGMSWCITSCNEDLDVDLFFQEDSSIGQRIKLGENIIRSLRRMKCPYKLESYQIQGGANTADYVNIFPIIQWLVKKVIETREETGDLMRLFSESQFSKTYSLPSDIEKESHCSEAITFVQEVSDRYKINRKYRRGGRRVSYLNRKSEEESVQSVLLEYGDNNLYNMNNVSQKSEKEKPEIANQLERALGGKGNESKQNKFLEEQENEKRKQNELKKELEEYSQPIRIDKDKLDSYLPQNISELESQYQYNEDLDQDISINQQKYGLRLHEQQVNKLNHDIDSQKSQILEYKKIYQDLDTNLKDVQSQYAQKSAYNQRIILEISKLDALETPENTKQLHMLRSLIALNENLRTQESRFKSNCKRQLQSLKDQIDSIKSEVSASETNGGEASLVNDTLNQLQAKLSKVKGVLSKRNRDISLIERKIDEVPERSELAQYQRQFVELYEQVASKFTETRQYYNTYNTLEDSKSYLAKEVSILNSINDSFKNAMSSKSSREQFIESLNNILKSVIQSLEKTEQKLTVEKDNKVSLNEKYNSLVDKERLYFKATKEFLEECKRNELLLSKIEQ